MQKRQDIVLITKSFHLPALSSRIIKNNTSSIKVFVHKKSLLSDSLKKISLYKHLHIYLCNAPVRNMIMFKKTSLFSKIAFDKDLLRDKKASIYLKKIDKKDLDYALFLEQRCEPY